MQTPVEIDFQGMEAKPELRSAMNIKYFDGLEKLAGPLNLRVAAFDRRQCIVEHHPDGAESRRIPFP